MSFHDRDIVRQIVAELLEARIIEKLTSPYASSVLLVKKKDGGHRQCVCENYRKIKVSLTCDTGSSGQIV